MPADPIRILFIADIVGKPGRDGLAAVLPGLAERKGISLCIVNGENTAGGLGITPKIAAELTGMGVHVITNGNHVWNKKDIVPYLDEGTEILRPLNYPPGTPGRGSGIFYTDGGVPVGVVCLEGRVFMNPVECPFRAVSAALPGLQEKAKIIFVDMHAEATSEKRAMGWFLDGKVTAVIGTHTHVQTGDEEILPGGTAYLTDAGMTGSFDSVIGVDKNVILQKFLTQRPVKFTPATGDVRVAGAVVTCDPETGQATDIERILEKTGG